MASVAPPPMGGLDYARIGMVFLGAVLSIVGALAPWVARTLTLGPISASETIGLINTCSQSVSALGASGTVGATECKATLSVSLLAGGALLLIGFSKFVFP